MKPDAISLYEIKIPVSDLKIGMYVCGLDKEWGESSFVFQGFVVNNEKLIEKLTKECRYVYIDEKKGLTLDKTAARLGIRREKKPKKSFLSALFSWKKSDKITRKETYQLRDIVEQKVSAKTIRPPQKLHSFEEEFDTAKEVQASANAVLKDFMLHVKQGGPIDMIVAKQAVCDCMNSILRAPDAMLLLNRLKSKDYNLWQHSMNVSMLAINLGRYLNLHDDELILLGLCGMFHDIGKLRLSKTAIEIAVDKEKALQIHTKIGRDILLNSMGQLAELASEVAYSHHEYLDGKGYPRGLGGAQISSYTRMIAIVNLYDNLITDKPEAKGLTHYDAMVILLEKAQHQLDETLVNSFNQCMGVYPVGSIVELSSGEVAIVVEENEKLRLRPKVMLLTAPNKQPCERNVLNLADNQFMQKSEAYFIKAIVRADKYGLKV